MTDPLLKIETYAYDEAGNLKQVTDRKGQVSGFLYDFLNRRTFEGYGATAANPTAYTRTVNTLWDAGNRVKQITDSDSGIIVRDYTGLDLLKQEITPQGEVDYTYYANGLRHTQAVLGQPAITYTYDNGNRPYQIIQGTSVVTLGFDEANRRTSLTLPNGITLTYTLDDASQVKQIDYVKGVTVIGSITYDYDAAGRRTQMGGSLARGNLPQVMTALYDDANRQIQFNGRTLNYDDNGNLTSDGLRAFTWDAANRLTQLTGSATGSFQYDPMGRRISKTVAGNQTGYLYDGINPVQELAGTTPTANLLTGGVDEYFTRTDANGTRNYVTDALGSVLALSDDTGALNTQYSYDPYGNTTRTGEANTNSYQYTGRENDGTGLYYYRARYYDPELSRFVQSDPIGLAGGINTYAYVVNNPINYIDPTGLILCSLLKNLGDITIDLDAGIGIGLGVSGGLSLSSRGITGNVTAGSGIGLGASAGVSGTTNISSITSSSGVGTTVSVSGGAGFGGSGAINAGTGGVTATGVIGVGFGFNITSGFTGFNQILNCEDDPECNQ